MPKSVLVADDSITMRKVIGMVFSTEDFSVTMVDNGLDAIHKARELRPDLVIADCMMPGKTGYEVAHAIRSDPSTAHTPVMLLAGSFEPFDENRARASGATAHIVKPFDSQSFMDRVRNLVGMAAGAGPINTVAPVSTGGPVPSRPAVAPPPTGIPMGTQPGMMRPAGAPGMPPGGMPRPPGGGIPTGTQPGMRSPMAPPGAPGMPRPGQTGAQPAYRPPGMPGGPGVPMGTQPGMRPPGPGMPPQGMARPGMPPPGMPGGPGLPRPPGGAPLPGGAPPRRDPFGLGAPPPGGPLQGRPGMPPPGRPPPAAAPHHHETLSLDDKPADGGEAQLRAALSAASKEVIEKIAWEVVPQLAETIIREELDRLIKEREAKGLA